MKIISNLIKQVLGNRQSKHTQDSTWRQDEVHNRRNDHLSFHNPDFLANDSTSGSKSRFVKVFIITFIVTLCSLTALDFYGSNVVRQLNSYEFFRKITHYFDRKETTVRNSNKSVPEHTVEKPTSNRKSTNEYEFSPKDIAKAKQELLKINSQQYWTQEEINLVFPPDAYGDNKYLYEIELISGGHLTADNLVMKEDFVEYSDNKGLILTIEKKEVKTIKRLKVNR